jgi:hypothetical protein
VSVQYDATKDNWWLSVGFSVAGETYRSLTKKLLFERWLACNVLENARMSSQTQRGLWVPVTVRIMKNGEPQSEDVI